MAVVEAGCSFSGTYSETQVPALGHHLASSSDTSRAYLSLVSKRLHKV